MQIIALTSWLINTHTTDNHIFKGKLFIFTNKNLMISIKTINYFERTPFQTDGHSLNIILNYHSKYKPVFSTPTLLWRE